MTKREAINRLRKNKEEWEKAKKKLNDSNVVKEIDLDYEAIEILLAQTRLDYENMTYEELVEIYKIVKELKTAKYYTSKTRKDQNKRSREKHPETIKEIQKRYRENHRELVNERSKAYWRRDIEKSRARKRELYRKKKDNEKVITLFG